MAISGDHVMLVGSERPARSDARLVGPADANERLTVTVEVRQRPDAPPPPDLAALGAQRPRERERIDRAALAATYGADPEDLAKVAEFAKEYNLTVEGSRLRRHVPRPRGPRSGPARAVNVVKRVSGLTNRPLARPHVLVRPLEVTNFDAAQIGQIYDFPTGVDGTGTCSHPERGCGQRRRGGEHYGDPADGEVELDIEVAGSTARANPRTPAGPPRQADNPGFGWATGGGISDQFGLPSWQAGKGVPVSVNNGVSVGRGVPDVAADADPHTGYKVVVDGTWAVEGGTSAVAPLYAGLFALLNQSFGFPLGFITPFVYSLYETNAFVDITRGTNQIYPAPGYSAGAGWDACSGLGRIDGKNLLAELQ